MQGEPGDYHDPPQSRNAELPPSPPLQLVGTTRSPRPLGSNWGEGDRNDNIAHTTWTEGSGVIMTCAQRINEKNPVSELHICKKGDWD